MKLVGGSLLVIVLGALGTGCLGSASSVPSSPTREPSFVITYLPGYGNLATSSDQPTQVTSIRCGSHDHLLCGALAYYAVHAGSQPCLQPQTFSTPARIQVAARLHGRLIKTLPRPLCRVRSRLFASAARLILSAALPNALSTSGQAEMTPRLSDLARRGAAL